MINNNKEIGNRIRSRRKELKLSVDQVAEEAGLAKTTIYRYESGDIKQIKLAVIERLGEILKVNPAWLLGKTDNKKQKTIGPLTGEARFDMCRVLDLLVDWLAEPNDAKWDGVSMNHEQKITMMSGLEAVKKMVEKAK